MNGLHVARPWWRRSLAYGGNAFRLVVLSGLRSWRRDLRMMAPAGGSAALVLVLAGTIALFAVAVAHVAADQAGQASVLTVYLAPEATSADVLELEAKLDGDPRVLSVTQVTAEEALAQARRRPGLGDLADLASSNPFAPSLEVRVRLVTEVGAVAASVAGDRAADPADPTSYDAGAYATLRNLALALGGAALLLVLLLGFTSYAVSANELRTIALARRDELALTRLLGARRWMLRGSFVVEGMMTGALAGAVAGAVLFTGWWLSTRLGAGLYSAILPGVGARSIEVTIAALITAGLLLGSVSAAFGVRRLTA